MTQKKTPAKASTKQPDLRIYYFIAAAIVIFVAVVIYIGFTVKFDVVDECASPCEGTDSEYCPSVCVRRTYKMTLFEIITNKKR